MTHNTREGVEEIVTKMKRHVIWQDNEQGMLEDRLRELLHQELQKARESERARIEDEFAKVAKYTQDFEPDAYGENPVNTSYYQLYEGQWEYIIKPKDQSELDQPTI